MTLTQAALITRRGVLLIIVAIILVTTIKLGYSFYLNYQLSKLPPIEEVAEQKYGSLPLPEFPPSAVSSSNYSYTIDTTTGELPSVPKLINVYFIPKSGLSLLAPDRARALAQKLGFSIGPQTISDDEYQFTDSEGGKLVINIKTGNFKFDKIATSSAEVSLPDKNQLISDLKVYLSQKIDLPQEVIDGRSEVNGEIVSLWPTDIDKRKIITGHFKEGLIKATVTASTDPERLFSKLQYTYWPVDLTSYSTYSLKTPVQALDDLKNGLGYIAITPQKPQVSITSVELAYYQSEEYSPYLQPIYVFEGPSFVALIPAISQ